MPSLKDLTGKTFGRLVVLSRGQDATNSHGRPIVRWICRCECGNETLVMSHKLNHGVTQSCGCLQKDVLRDRVKTHGMRHTKAYRAWAAAKSRCYNPRVKGFHNWGGRGIKMCDRWLNSFEAFYEDMGEPPIGYTLDRFPNQDGNYEPGNCRWATPKEQSNNLRTTNFYEWNGMRKSLTDWALYFNVTRDLIKLRLKRGREFSAVCKDLSR